MFLLLCACYCWILRLLSFFFHVVWNIWEIKKNKTYCTKHLISLERLIQGLNTRWCWRMLLFLCWHLLTQSLLLPLALGSGRTGAAMLSRLLYGSLPCIAYSCVFSIILIHIVCDVSFLRKTQRPSNCTRNKVMKCVHPSSYKQRCLQIVAGSWLEFDSGNMRACCWAGDKETSYWERLTPLRSPWKRWEGRRHKTLPEILLLPSFHLDSQVYHLSSPRVEVQSWLQKILSEDLPKPFNW